MDLRRLLGQPVHVVVDRPMGYRHGDILYPVNYGYIPGMIAPDGEEQDVYILGVDHPVTSFDGQVIGIIRRANDFEDKLVAAPEGSFFHQAQIAEAVRFQEQFFHTTVESLYRKSCGVIPYRHCLGRTEYLILLQTSNSWSFPKGHMEPGETEPQTALRELYEETGLTATLLPDAFVTAQYKIPPLTQKQVTLFLGHVQGKLTLQEKEITDCRWVTAEELPNYLHPDTCKVCAPLLTR